MTSVVQQQRPAVVVHLLISLLLTLLWYSALPRYLHHDFIGIDTIFNLEPIGQFSLAVLSFLLIAGLLLLNLYKSHLIANCLIRDPSSRIRLLTTPLLDLVVSVCIVTCALVVAPQILYVFYQQIFPELPPQWVVAWPSASLMQTILTLSPPHTLHDAMCGLLYWAVVAGVLLFWLRRYTATVSASSRFTFRLLILLALSATIITLS